MYFLKRVYLLVFMICSSMLAAEASLEELVKEKYKPNLRAHGYHFDYSLYGPLQSVGSRVSYSFNATYAYRLGGRFVFQLEENQSETIRYLPGLMGQSEILVRSPILIHDYLRPYFVSGLNMVYLFEGKTSLISWSPKSGLEIYTAQNWSLSFEVGLNLPLYKVNTASTNVGGVVAIMGGYYF